MNFEDIVLSAYIDAKNEDTPRQYEDGPGYIDYYPSGNKKIVKFYHGFRVSRFDGNPSVITYYDDENENIMFKSWYFTDSIQRDVNEGPAYISYFQNGNKKLEVYRDAYEYPIDNGPYKIQYSSSGIKKYEKHLIESNGIPSKIILEFYKTGELKAKHLIKSKVSLFYDKDRNMIDNQEFKPPSFIKDRNYRLEYD